MSMIQQLRQEISLLESKLKSIQNDCSHPPLCVVKEAKSGSSDGYSTDRYWYSCYCELCEKQWNEDQ